MAFPPRPTRDLRHTSQGPSVPHASENTMKRLTRTKRALLGAGASLALIATISACTPVPNVPIAAPGVCYDVKPLVSDNAQFITRCSAYGPLRWDTANNTGVPIYAPSFNAAMSNDGSIFQVGYTPVAGGSALTRVNPSVSREPITIAALGSYGNDDNYVIQPNAAGTRVALKYFGSNDAGASVVVDLTVTPAKVIPISALIGKQPKTVAPTGVSIAGDVVTTLLVDAKAPTVMRFHTFNLANGAQTDGIVPIACSVDVIWLRGAVAFCNKPTGVLEFNVLTGVTTSYTTLAYGGGAARVNDGSRILDISTGGNLTVTYANGTSRVLDTGVTLWYAFSSGGTAFLYEKTAADGSKSTFAVSY